MASLFEGSPINTSTTTSTVSQTPGWMQQAIYELVNNSRLASNLPYQDYDASQASSQEALAGNRIASPTAMQQQAWGNVQDNVGMWQPQYQQAMSGYSDLSQSPGAAAAANPYLSQQSGALGSVNYNQAQDTLSGAQGQYTDPALAQQALQSGMNSFGQAGDLDVVGAASPLLQQAGNISGLSTSQPYMGEGADLTRQSAQDNAMNYANPYLQSSGQTAASQVGQYMNPYNQNVTDEIAKMGARNLQENLLPSTSDAFIRAGQFGSSRMGEFGSRALRDTQDAVLREQANALQQGYTQSLGAAQSDLARQGQLAETVGQITGTDLNRILSAGGQLGQLGVSGGQLANADASRLADIGQTYGQLTSNQMQNLGNLGAQQVGHGTNQQTLGLDTAGQLASAQQTAANQQLAGASQYGSMGQLAGNLSQTDAATQQAALNAMLTGASQGQELSLADTGALAAAGQDQQLQNQILKDTAYEQFQNQQVYPQKQLGWLSQQLGSTAPLVPTSRTNTQSGVSGYSASPASQIGSALALYNGMTQE